MTTTRNNQSNQKTNFEERVREKNLHRGTKIIKEKGLREAKESSKFFSFVFLVFFFFSLSTRFARNPFFFCACYFIVIYVILFFFFFFFFADFFCYFFFLNKQTQRTFCRKQPPRSRRALSL